MRTDPASPPARWKTRAFGLEISASFPAPGLPEAAGLRQGRPTRVDLVSPAEIDRGWPVERAKRVLEERFGRDQPARTIDADPRAGYRLYARHFGLARVSPSGARILCSPPDVAPWRWQRFLVGRILPWASVLRGFEVFHASAVTHEGRALALVGPTGAGKTSLAIQLVMAGARFLTDDVLALERSNGEVLAHPGASIASVRAAEKSAISSGTWRGLGRVLGHSGKTYVALPREDGPVPLGSVYFLRAGAGPTIEPLERPDARLLLASTFVLGVQTADRLRNQLDICAAIAGSVPMFSLRVAPGMGSEELAGLVQEHAHEALVR